MDVGSTRVQLKRLPDRDRDGAWAYKWRTTVTREPGRRSYTEGVLLAHPERGVTRLGPDVEGLMTAVAVLAEERRRIGRLPATVDRHIPEDADVTSTASHSTARRPARPERPGRRRETLGERAARWREEEDSGGG